MGEIGTIVVESAAAEALGLSVEMVKALSLRDLFNHATYNGLDVNVELLKSPQRHGRVSVTYKPDRRRGEPA